MNLDEFNKLEDEFEKSSFEKENKKIHDYLYYGSFLPNLVLIILGFAFLNNKLKIIPEVFSGQFYVLSFISLGILAFYELAKREVLFSTIKSLVKNQKLTLKIFFALIFSILMLTGSFYLSLNGAKELVDKKEEVKIKTDSSLTNDFKRIDSIYSSQINSLQSKIDYTVDVAKSKERSLNGSERKDVERWEENIKELSTKKEDEKNKIEKKINEFKKEENLKTDNNQTVFVLIGVFLEFLILFGVGFKPYYQWKSYKDKKEELIRNPNYEKYQLYDSLIKTLFQNGKKMKNSELPSGDMLFSSIKSKGIFITDKELIEFLKLMSTLKIIINKGRGQSRIRLALCDMEEARKTIKDYFEL